MAVDRSQFAELHTGDDADEGDDARCARHSAVIEDFGDFLASLNSAQVRYLIVGAHALAVHGVPRATGDLDVWVESTSENGARIWTALRSFGAPLQALSLSESDFSSPDTVIQLGLPPYRIDILTSISGVTFAEAFSDRVVGTLFGVEVGFIGREAFIRNKRATGRMKDLEDVRSLGA